MSKDIIKDRILVLDFGSQYTQLIARRVREIGVYCEIYHYKSSLSAIKKFNPQGIILSGGPETVEQKGSPKVPDKLFDLEIPLLGICYGMQTIANQLGGKVELAKKREFGHADLSLKNLASGLFKGIKSRSIHVWMSHGDHVSRLPKGFKSCASSNNSPIAALFHPTKKIFGLQFHPEVTHTPQGKKILKNFVRDICNCEGLWNSKSIISKNIKEIRESVGSDEVLLGLSGGVDSAVVAALLSKAIGDQLTCVFVDNGLLRLNEGDQVMQTFKDKFGIKVKRANSGNLFLRDLKGKTDPEDKRKAIGKTFIDVFLKEAKKRKKIKWLAQGTIYPDVIESAGNLNGTAHVIKSHHNVGGLPDYLNLPVIEPLKDLFKDEVRKIGLELGLPREILFRHPFPGPGLGVRILGEIKKEYIRVLQLADDIYIKELVEAGYYDKVSQAFAVFLPVKSVGVVGDSRRYEYVIALRAVETVDFMTAKSAALPHRFLEKVSNRIMNEVPEVSRVTYDISSKPPSTIEWE
ncbi:MAG: glutamine-hydrolyzing GMP synthase [SAR86 cluster bacterium]|nr:glutamine-hydrolyzing GMP synthase [SAR86 cluster bacterium]